MSLYADLQKTKNESDIEMVYKKYFDKLFKKDKGIQITREQNKDGIIIGDSDIILLSRSFILSSNVQDTIRINIEGNFNLRDSTRSRRNSREFKFTE